MTKMMAHWCAHGHRSSATRWPPAAPGAGCAAARARPGRAVTGRRRTSLGPTSRSRESATAAERPFRSVPGRQHGRGVRCAAPAPRRPGAGEPGTLSPAPGRCRGRRWVGRWSPRGHGGCPLPCRASRCRRFGRWPAANDTQAATWVPSSPRELSATQMVGLQAGHAPRPVGTEVGHDSVDVGQDEEGVGPERDGEQRGGHVLVDHGLDAGQPSRPRSARTARRPHHQTDQNLPRVQQRLDGVELEDLAGRGDGDDPRTRAPSRPSSNHAWRRPRERSPRRTPADQLGGRREGRVVGVDERPGSAGRPARAHAGVVQLLDQPVADHALGLGAEGVQRVGPRQRRCRSRTLDGEQADLRAVAVADDDARARAASGGQLGAASADVPPLDSVVRAARPAAAGRSRPGRRRCARLSRPSAATRTALMVCIRFSAWWNTTEAGELKTSSVTSAPSSP